MRHVWASLAVVCGAFVGCGTGQPTPADRPAEARRGDPAPSTAAKPNPADRLPTSTDITFNGGNAAFWGKALFETNAWLEAEIETGMFEMKEEGLRFSLKALTSRSDTARALAARTLSYTAKDYEDVFFDPLAAMLEKGTNDERRSAARAMERCGYKRAAPLIRKSADGLTDPAPPGARSDMLRYAGMLEKAK